MSGGRIEGVELWDGRAPRGAVDLDWSGGLVEAVDPARGPAREGLSVIPGLVDTHVHLDVAVAEAGPIDGSWASITPEADQSLHVVGNTLRFARAGVTTLRDLWSSAPQFAASRALEEGVLAGPRLLAYGPVGMTAGHGDLFTPRGITDRPPVADGVDECRRLVRRWARDGARGIKIYTSGGILSLGDEVGWRNHTREETEAIVDEAHALRMRVAAHALNPEGIDVAIAVGVDSIEHATGMLPRHHAALLARNIPVAPTLVVHEAILEGDDPRRAIAREQTREIVIGRDRELRAAADAGVRFVLGTDANGRLVPYTGAHRELRRMSELLGWTAERTLVAGTSDAADSLGLGDRVGVLEPGYSADFVVVRGRPWLDLADLTAESIVAVVARGRLLHGALPD